MPFIMSTTESGKATSTPGSSTCARDRLRQWDMLLLQLGLSLQCLPTMLEHLPTAQVQAMAANLNDILSSRKG